MEPEHSEDRWLTLAQAVSRGEQVNWDHVEQQAADPQDNDVVRALRALDGIARVHKSKPSATASVLPESERITVEFDRWRHLTILERVGEGTFGVVYRALEDGLQREVALKLLWPKAADRPIDPDAVLSEARLLARVRHPNVVTVFGAESVEGRVGLWMEFIRGRTLEDLLNAHGAFGAREAATIGIDLCHALAAVHGAGLLHRDVKCQNVMREEGGRIVLMDFGAGAELSLHRLATQDDVAGTPLYLAPELFGGDRPSVSADIYSLGVLMFHLVSGGYPVEGHTREQIVVAHQQGQRRRLRDSRPDLPDAFVRVVERALAHDPAARHETAGAFADELATWLGFAHDTAASNGSNKQSGSRDQRPTRSWLVAAGVILLAGVVAGAVWWGPISTARRASREGQAATDASGPLRDAGVIDPAYEIDARFHVVKASKGTILKSGDRLAPGDLLFLTIQSSRPLHVYVVNQDEEGESYLNFPVPGQNLTNPLPAGSVNRLPGSRGTEEFYWQVTSVGGREHFYVFASPRPLDEFERSVATLPRPQLDKPILSLPLPKHVVETLRGVGGLAKTEISAPSTTLDFPFATPLLDTAETTRGFWAREIVFVNPAK